MIHTGVDILKELYPEEKRWHGGNCHSGCFQLYGRNHRRGKTATPYSIRYAPQTTAD